MSAKIGLMVNGSYKAPRMTTSEVAYMLDIHRNTVRRWNNRGFISANKINDRGDRRFTLEDIARFRNQLLAHYANARPDSDN
jgi:excisionase family DNA binding protein